MTSADLTVCDREPITRLEGIQSFGFLLAMSDDWVVTRASANLGAMLGVEARRAIGAKLDQLIDPETLHDLRNRMAFLRGRKGIERLYKKVLVGDRPSFDVAIHYSDELIVLEGEPSLEDGEYDAGSLVCRITARLSRRTTIESYHKDAAQQIRVLTGFDRIMIYRFAEDGSGEVIAESLTRGMESFLGRHFPASDIPAQARALYLLNSFRIIADVHASAVPLLPECAVPLDLSSAMTRAISPVHIEYLKNMGVGASLSVSIIVDGKLWGLITCHNRSARLPDYGHRTAVELFGHIFSITLESWLKQSQIDTDEKARALIESMSREAAGDVALLSDARWVQDTLREIIDCDGVASLIADQLQCCGSVPSAPEIRSIAGALAGNSFVTNHLPAIRPQAAVYASDAAGMLAIPLSTSPHDYLLLFRREQRREIAWAGNPLKAVIASEDGMRISPRKSFNAFLENVRGRSRPFTAAERRAAEALRSSLIDVFARAPTRNEEQRKSFERQELLIAELNHRVRNILSLIRGLISQSNGNQGDIAGYVDSLNGRVHAIARAHDQITKQNWGPGRLSELLEGEIMAYIPERKERFRLVGPSLSLLPMAFSTFSLVIHELVTNSAKYGALSDSGLFQVTVECRPGVGVDIRWRESEGPAVSPPTRRGFGSVIIERMVPFDLQGTADVRYHAAGLEADFFIPEKYIADDVPDLHNARLISLSPEAQPGDLPDQPLPLAGYHVLLVEDNMIIALESEHLLRELGADTILTVTTESAAEQVLAAEPVHFALLDVHLGHGTSLRFAEQLASAGVPFVFASGYGENVSLGDLHRTSVTVMKPFNRGTLRAAIVHCLDRQNAPAAREDSAEDAAASPV